jgi:endonuclease/exonuclease/phosphatase family metal-dependent hydrolase
VYACPSYTSSPNFNHRDKPKFTRDTVTHTVNTLRICEYNIENLFISLDYYDGQDLNAVTEEEWKSFALPQLQRKQKPLHKLKGVTKAIFDINADIIMLIEVGGQESLDLFCHHFLEDEYIPHFIAGNSKRNIDLAFLVRRDFQYDIAVGTNKEKEIEVESYTGTFRTKFSRDVAELRILDGEETKLILLLTHLKSKISSDLDFQGKDMRTAEAKVLAELYLDLRNSNPDVPVVLAGDFNSELEGDEFVHLRSTDLIDFHDALDSVFEDRISLVHFDYFKKAHLNILDYILLSPELEAQIIAEESFTYRYKSFYDIPNELPKIPAERYIMASDHYPLVVTLHWPLV